MTRSILHQTLTSICYWSLDYPKKKSKRNLTLKLLNNPKNAIFHAADFRPEFIDMLHNDQAILEQMLADWKDISDEDDSKFAKFNELLKHELFRSDRNPEKKLVVFSEQLILLII